MKLYMEVCYCYFYFDWLTGTQTHINLHSTLDACDKRDKYADFGGFSIVRIRTAKFFTMSINLYAHLHFYFYITIWMSVIGMFV